MKNISIKEGIIPKLDDILNLYNDVSWSAYTSSPEQLENALKNSFKVWTAWDDDLLIGLARVIGDGYTVIYIQDIIVLNEYQGKGFGSKFLKLILDEYRDIRQIILLTEDSYKTIKFYENNGLTQVGEYNCVAFMK
ncbi:GNAT family N-acetyltransferase [Anaerococcus sp. AGMB00486]|uniref:GNAT family N-acetyltransferase n=2 Tax=Anaerococcus TaxID=165779 RepID=A0ABX2N9U8_9FIRM|nr:MULTISPECIES: GNAT family N-acetyltransferase [Anaerococcus]MDY3006960.1 GNAT family N-acetyltransferase [Anaerococcus porci]MSS78556.1 GNAT family N-acetyltransferase [Anaerococcus porci]NVF11453.1 GNAT family N-acetyltransferase [Anaerococcus faecalis]